jgi:hypothetical protein
MNVHYSNSSSRHSGLINAVVVTTELLLLLLTLFLAPAKKTVVMAFHIPSVALTSPDVPTTKFSTSPRRSSILPLYASLTIPPSESRPSKFDENNNKSSMQLPNQQKQHDITIEKFEIHHDHQDDDDDDNNDEQVEHLTETAMVASHSKGMKPTYQHFRNFDPFLAYLYGMIGPIHNPNVVANRLDDELKRMESRFFDLIGDDLPVIRYPLGWDNRGYNKRPRWPTLEVYELVAWAYSKSTLREDGALLAENVLQRFQTHNPHIPPSMKIMASIMKAWIAAKNLDKTQYWLNQIEDQFQHHHVNDSDERNVMLPGFAVYHPLVVGLQTMNNNKDNSQRIADLTVRAIETMRANLAATTQDDVSDWYLPSTVTYLAAMNNVKNCTYDRIQQFDCLEKLLRYQLEDYRRFGRRPRSKAGAKQSFMTVLVAAGYCTVPKNLVKVVDRCENIMQQYHQLYQETGDMDFRPTPKMYERVITLYARSNRRENPQIFADRTLSLLQSMKQVGGEFEDSYVAKAAMNRVMQTAESSMLANPMQDPVRTREMFEICLTIFKHFYHRSSSSNNNSNNNNSSRSDMGNALATPNASTYQIFLRACSHLPPGETRSKLSAKAFSLCKQNGLVSKGVGKELYSSNPTLAAVEFGSTTTAEEFTRGTIVIPAKWSRNDTSHKMELEIVNMELHDLKQ